MPAVPHRRLLDAGAVALALLGTYLSLGPSRPVLPGESTGWWWVDLVGGLLGAAALLARDRRPVAVGVVVGVLLSVVVTTTWLAGLVATFAVAVRRPWPTAAAVGLVGLAVGPVQDLLRPLTDEVTSWGTLGYAAVIVVAVVACGAALRARHQLLASLVDRAERAEAEAGLRADAVRAAERTRIAREMHDVLAHRLSLVSLHAGALAHRPDASPAEVRDALAVVRDGARDALGDLRAILGVLRGPATAGDVEPAAAAPQPTLADLDRLLDDVRATGVVVELRDERADGATVPDECGRTLYRVTQEALTNATRHAPGEPVALVLRGAPGTEAELEVSNPLPATGPAAGPSSVGAGTGLLGVAERVALAGGRVLARGPQEGRFRLAVAVPWTVAP